MANTPDQIELDVQFGLHENGSKWYAILPTPSGCIAIWGSKTHSPKYTTYGRAKFRGLLHEKAGRGYKFNTHSIRVPYESLKRVDSFMERVSNELSGNSKISSHNTANESVILAYITKLSAQIKANSMTGRSADFIWVDEAEALSEPSTAKPKSRLGDTDQVPNWGMF